MRSLEAFLAYNEEFEIVFGAQSVVRADDQRLQRLVPSFSGGGYPSSFWIRRRPRA